MDDLDLLVRRVDEDRWLASRFAPAAVRERLIAIYAVNYEIARTAEVARESALGEIRLAWWRDAICEIYDGKAPRDHPALEAYAKAHRQTPLPRSAIEAMIDERRRDLYAVPFETVVEFDDYLDRTAGNVMRLAIAACAEPPEADRNDTFVHWAGWIWGCVGLLRSQEYWAARGRTFIPTEGGSVEKLRARAEGAYREMRTLHKLDPAVFPAIGYVRLAEGYMRVVRNGKTARPLLLRQLGIVAAAATGRF